MVGEKQLVHLANRRCQRCGALVWLGNVNALASMLDEIVQHRARGFCAVASQAAETLEAPKICIVCLAIGQKHIASAARGKTK